MLPKTMQQWVENAALSSVTTNESKEIVFPTDDISPVVIAAIIEIWNNGDGDNSKSVTEITEYLSNSDIVTTDEIDFILERITDFVSQVEEPVAPIVLPTVKVVETKQPVVLVEPVKEGVVASTTPEVPKAIVRKERKPREVTKRLTFQELSAALKSRLEVIDIMSSVVPVEIPSGCPKATRELLTDYNDELATLIDKYLNIIADM